MEEIVRALTSLVGVLDEEPGAQLESHPRHNPRVDVELPEDLEHPSPYPEGEDG